jgi:hypothetical protein
MTTTELCESLQVEQRNRVAMLKSRIMLENRLTANVAGWMGYKASDDEKQREKQWKAAGELIKEIGDDEGSSHPLRGLVFGSQMGIDSFDITVKAIEKAMVKLAKQLPAATWAQEPEQRGFGVLSLAIIAGECGDLANYANPAKVWKRMGCAPFESRGKTFMGATWKSGKEGSLTAEEWSQFGYSPRRRSIAYVMGENLVKQNQTGPYRTRYDEVKASAAISREDWKPLRCHRHAMLLSVKLLLKNLWIEWNGGGDKALACESGGAAIVLI